ncbi:MAG: hypothetical protein ABGZ17_17240, partial [Planctomycetaceae bacterium]
EKMATAIADLTGLDIAAAAIEELVLRTFLRGYRLEKQQGFQLEDYDLPGVVHLEYPQIELPHFNTREFFEDLRLRVTQRFDDMLETKLATMV